MQILSNIKETWWFVNNGIHIKVYRWRLIWIISIIVLAVFVNSTAQSIKFGSIGAIDAENKHSHVYYMIRFSSSQYTLQKQ